MHVCSAGVPSVKLVQIKREKQREQNQMHINFFFLYKIVIICAYLHYDAMQLGARRAHTTFTHTHKRPKKKTSSSRNCLINWFYNCVPQMYRYARTCTQHTILMMMMIIAALIAGRRPIVHQNVKKKREKQITTGELICNLLLHCIQFNNPCISISHYITGNDSALIA